MKEKIEKIKTIGEVAMRMIAVMGVMAAMVTLMMGAAAAARAPFADMAPMGAVAFPPSQNQAPALTAGASAAPGGGTTGGAFSARICANIASCSHNSS